MCIPFVALPFIKHFLLHAIFIPNIWISSIRALELPCLTCLTWSHFIQDKLKISIYLSLDKYKCIKWIQFCISYFDLLLWAHMLHCKQCGSWSAGFFRSQLIWIYTVFKRVNCLSKERYKLISCFGGVKFSWTSTLWPFTCPWTSRKFYYFHTPVYPLHKPSPGMQPDVPQIICSATEAD